MVEILTPRSFFGFIPIQTGAEIIAATVVINKASAPYGLGALFTGKGLSPMQWVMNVLSFIAFPIAIWGYMGIVRRRPLRTLVFTYFYVIDTLVSLGFTIFFIIFWFAYEGKAVNNPPQSSLHDRDVGLFIPEEDDLFSRSNASGSPGGANTTTSKADYSKSTTVGQELATTVVATTIFLVIRFYFMIVLVGYARILVRQNNLRPFNGDPQRPWLAKVQYTLLKPLEYFWTGQYTRTRRRSTFGPAETQALRETEEIS